jgi:hypothetical protein
VSIVAQDMINGMESVQYRNTYDPSFERIGRTDIA